MLTWSKDVISDGAQGEIIPISVVLLGKMGQAFFLGNLSIYFNLHYQFLVPSHCWQWAVVGMTWFVCSAADVWGVGGQHGWVSLECSLGVPSGLSGLCQGGPGLRETPLVSSTAQILYLCPLSTHGLLWGKAFCLKLHFQTVKVYKWKVVLWPVTVIGFKQTFPAYFLPSPEVYSITSRLPIFFLNRLLP